MLVIFMIILILLFLNKSERNELFNIRNNLITPIIIIFIIFGLHKPINLSWYDSPMAFHFHIEAIGNSGKVYQIPPRYLEPYDLPFAQGRFYFLSKNSQLVDALGATQNRTLYDSLNEVTDIIDIQKIRQQMGREIYDESRISDFIKLLSNFIKYQ